MENRKFVALRWADPSELEPVSSFGNGAIWSEPAMGVKGCAEEPAVVPAPQTHLGADYPFAFSPDFPPLVSLFSSGPVCWAFHHGG